MILFASRTLGLSAGVIGLAFGIGALGVVGAVLAPRLAARFGVGRVIVAGAILFPAPLALLALAGGPTWAAATVLAVVEFVSALGVMCFDVNLNSLQTTSVIPDEVAAVSQARSARSTTASGRSARSPAGSLGRMWACARRSCRRRDRGRRRSSGCCPRRFRLCARSRSSRLRSEGRGDAALGPAASV